MNWSQLVPPFSIHSSQLVTLCTTLVANKITKSSGSLETGSANPKKNSHEEPKANGVLEDPNNKTLNTSVEKHSTPTLRRKTYHPMISHIILNFFKSCEHYPVFLGDSYNMNSIVPKPL